MTGPPRLDGSLAEPNSTNKDDNDGLTALRSRQVLGARLTSKDTGALPASGGGPQSAKKAMSLPSLGQQQQRQAEDDEDEGKESKSPSSSRSFASLRALDAAASAAPKPQTGEEEEEEEARPWHTEALASPPSPGGQAAVVVDDDDDDVQRQQQQQHRQQHQLLLLDDADLALLDPAELALLQAELDGSNEEGEGEEGEEEEEEEGEALSDDVLAPLDSDGFNNPHIPDFSSDDPNNNQPPHTPSSTTSDLTSTTTTNNNHTKKKSTIRKTTTTTSTSASKKAKNTSASIMEMLNQRKQAHESAERERIQRKENLAKARIYHPLQQQLREVLLSAGVGTRFFGAGHLVSVRNDSYWYAQRNSLGGRNHMARIVALEKSGASVGKYQASIMDLKRDPTDFSLKPMKTYLGLFSSQRHAYQACDEAIALRDANPGEMQGMDKTGMDPSQLKCTHLHATIVSSRFVGLDYFQRGRLVYEALVAAYFVENNPADRNADLTDDEDFDDMSVKRTIPNGFAVRGDAVNKLPHMRHLGAMPFELALDLKTPGEHDPNNKNVQVTEEERGGRSRMETRAMNLDPKIKAASKASALREVIEPPAAKSGGGNKTGGVYGHFFHDMQPIVRQLMMEEYGLNMKLVKGDPAVIESGAYKKAQVFGGQLSVPVNDLSGAGDIGGGELVVSGQETAEEIKKRVNIEARMVKASVAIDAASKALELGEDPTRAAGEALRKYELAEAGLEDLTKGGAAAAEAAMKKKEAILGNKQVGQDANEDVEGDIVAKYQIIMKKVAGCAVRLQRIWRRRLLSIAARQSVKRHFGVLLLQKLVRGYYGREYASMLKVVRFIAIVKIQAAWRGVLGRRRAEQYRRMLTAFAVLVQPYVRGWIGRTYAAWLRENWKRAVLMQRVVRGYNHRRKVDNMMKAKFKQTLGAFAVKFQALMRGHKGRKVFRKRIEAYVFNKILAPCCTLLQRCWRGFLGRKTAFQKRLRRDATIEVQRHGRGLLKRRWLAFVKWKKYERRCAIKIQAHIKGWIDREILRRRRQKKYFVNVVLKSVLLIQSQYRGFVQRNNLVVLKIRWYNATRIQGCFRMFVAKRLAQKKWREYLALMKSNNCRNIQRSWRGFTSRRRTYQKKCNDAARRLYASRIIMRAWIRFRDSKRYRNVKEAWEVEQSAELLMDLDEERKEILEDLNDIEDDIAKRDRSLKRALKRLVELKEFTSQCSLRIPKVEWELERLDLKDVETGWAEAFSDEFERLHNQTRMAREEARLCKCNQLKLEAQLEKLWIEREDVNIDLDSVGTREMEEFELLRRMEVDRANARKKRDWIKRVRHEKNKWKVDDVRRTVIRRTRTDIDDIQKELKDARSTTRMATLGFWKRHDLQGAEKDKLKRILRERTKAKNWEVRESGANNTAIRSTFDAVISSTLDILKNGSFDGRTKKNDLRSDPQAMCRVCGRVFCECDQEKHPTNTYFKK